MSDYQDFACKSHGHIWAKPNSKGESRCVMCEKLRRVRKAKTPPDKDTAKA